MTLFSASHRQSQSAMGCWRALCTDDQLTAAIYLAASVAESEAGSCPLCLFTLCFVMVTYGDLVLREIGIAWKRVASLQWSKCRSS